MTEFDIGEFFIWGAFREVDGEYQAVIAMRTKEGKQAITWHQVEKDRWFKTAEGAVIAARDAAQALKTAVDAGALSV